MMIVLGLAGQAGAGKDTVADYLVAAYGFVKFAFSDALYDEVQIAFGLADQDLLRDRATKEEPTTLLSLQNCTDPEFVAVARVWQHANSGGAGMRDGDTPDTMPLSPRTILQLWGTEYRRAQDPEYWLHRSYEFLQRMQASAPYPEQRPQLFVNTAVRFENERSFIRDPKAPWAGNVWHIRREGVGAISNHVSENALPVLEPERELWNNDSIERLHAGIDLLFRTSAQFVKVEPMLPDVEPETAEVPNGD